MHSKSKATYLMTKRGSLKLIAGGFLSTSAALVACGGGSGTSSASTVPGVPTDLKAVVGNASITLSFAAPASDGGASITSYTYVCTPTVGAAMTGTATASPVTVSGLTNGAAYACTVAAVNSVGAGAASAAARQHGVDDGAVVLAKQLHDLQSPPAASHTNKRMFQGTNISLCCLRTVPPVPSLLRYSHSVHTVDLHVPERIQRG